MHRGLLVIILFALTGCRQPLGGRCQTADDCESGICSAAEPRTCREAAGEEIVVDAAPPDAKVDARADATPAPTIDAAPADAALADAALDVADADVADAQ